MNARRNHIGSTDERQLRILVIEDELYVARALKMILDEEGYGVDVAMTGQDALSRCAVSDFDLLIADLRLPDINGMDVVRKIKGDHPDTQVLVVTGHATVQSAVEAMKLGVFDYLPKPFTEEQLKTAVAAALQEKLESITRRAGNEGLKTAALIQKSEVVSVLNRTPRN